MESPKINLITYNNAISWMFINGPAILLDNDVPYDVSVAILHCVKLFCLKISQLKNSQLQIIHDQYKNFIKYLLEHSNKICVFMSDPKKHEDCCFLVATILNEFLISVNLQSKPLQIFTKMLNLPSNLMEWPETIDRTIFFALSFMFTMNNKLPWKYETILKCISDHIYQNRSSNIIILKSIYFLYPILIETIYPTKQFVALGYNLLSNWTQYYSIPILYTYDTKQLNWILRDGDHKMRLSVLRHWLRSSQNEECIMTALRQSEIQTDLLHLLMQESDSDLGKKIISLIREHKDEQLSIQVTSYLPNTIFNHNIFNVLIQCGPNIPTNPEHVALLCCMMGAMIPMMDSDECIRCACSFTCEMLVRSKRNANAVQQFCLRPENLRKLFDILITGTDDTAFEVIKLLEAILCVQNFTDVDLGIVHIDFLILLVCESRFKIRKCLDLMSYVLKSNKCIIKLNEESVVGVYSEIFESTHYAETAVMSCNCLILLMKQKPWLAVSPLSGTHLKILCIETEPDKPLAPIIVKLLYTWLKAILNQKYNAFCLIPEMEIKSFVMRISILQENEDQFKKFSKLISQYHRKKKESLLF